MAGSPASPGDWGYRRRTEADLDGDGTAEAVIIAARAEVLAGGAPIWEDGHAWAVYVEPQKGPLTLLYSAFVPNGFTEAAVLGPSSDGRRSVLIQERTPQRLRTFQLRYEGVQDARLVSATSHQIAQWLPGSARLGDR